MKEPPTTGSNSNAIKIEIRGNDEAVIRHSTVESTQAADPSNKMNGKSESSVKDESEDKFGVDNPAFENDSPNVINGKNGRVVNGDNNGAVSINHKLKDDLDYKSTEEMAEAVNLELMNMSSNLSNGLNGYNGLSGLPVKNPNSTVIDITNPYDEYFIPVNEHRKYIRGEKLYVTKSKRDLENSKKNCCVWIAGIVTLMVVISLAVLLTAKLSRDPTDESGFHKGVVHAGIGGISGSLSKNSASEPRLQSSVEQFSRSYLERAVEGEFTAEDPIFTADLAVHDSKAFNDTTRAIENELRNALFDKSTLNYGAADIFIKVINFTPQNVVQYRISWIFKPGIHNVQDPITVDTLKERFKEYIRIHNGTLNSYKVSYSKIYAKRMFDDCGLENGKCSHNCSFDYKNTLDFYCHCPENMRIDKTQYICEDIPTTILPSEDSPEIEDGVESKPEPEAEPEPEPEPSSSPEPKSKSSPSYNFESSTDEPEYEPGHTSMPEPVSFAEPKPELVTSSTSSSKPEPMPTVVPKSKSKPEPTVVPEPVSEPEPTSVPEPDSKPEPVSSAESKPEPETSSTPSSKPEPEPTSVSEPNSKPEPVSSAEPMPEPETSSTPSSKPEPEPTSVPEPNSKHEPVSSAEPKPELEASTTSSSIREPTVVPEPKSEPEPASIPEPSSKPEPTVVTEPKSEPEPTSLPEPNSKPELTVVNEPKPEPASVSESNSQPESTVVTEPKSEPESSKVSDSKSKPEPIAIAEPTTTSVHEIKPELELKPEPNATSEPKSEPEPTVTSEPNSKLSFDSQTNDKLEAKPEPEPEPRPDPEFNTPTHSEINVAPEPEPEPRPDPEFNTPTHSEIKVAPEPEPKPEPVSENSMIIVSNGEHSSISSLESKTELAPNLEPEPEPESTSVSPKPEPVAPTPSNVKIDDGVEIQSTNEDGDRKPGAASFENLPEMNSNSSNSTTPGERDSRFNKIDDSNLLPSGATPVPPEITNQGIDDEEKSEEKSSEIQTTKMMEKTETVSESVENALTPNSDDQKVDGKVSADESTLDGLSENTPVTANPATGEVTVVPIKSETLNISENTTNETSKKDNSSATSESKENVSVTTPLINIATSDATNPSVSPQPAAEVNDNGEKSSQSNTQQRSLNSKPENLAGLKAEALVAAMPKRESGTAHEHEKFNSVAKPSTPGRNSRNKSKTASKEHAKPKRRPLLSDLIKAIATNPRLNQSNGK